MSTVECYDCHARVRDLKSHRSVCPSKKSKTVKCYDCQEQVSDLKSHRAVCPSSRKAKTAVSGEHAGGHEHKYADNTDRYFLIDTSGSMAGSRIEQAKSTVLEIFQGLPENDRIAVITFDTDPYFRLKPRPVGQIRRQNELPDLLARFRTLGGTAIWDAIWMAIEQNKGTKTVLNVVTDGEDNSSKHSYQQILDLVAGKANITVNIIHVSDRENAQYKALCQNRGVYKVVGEVDIRITMKLLFV